MNQDLLRIIFKMKNGDLSEYQIFYDYTKDYVYKLLYQTLGDRANTVINNVYQKVYSNISSLVDVNAFYQWLGTFATDEALQLLLAESKINPVKGELTENICEMAYMDNEAFVSDKFMQDTEYHRIVYANLDALPNEAKLVLQYYYYENKSVSEIATKFGCEANLIRALLSDIKRVLKICMNDRYGKSEPLYSMAQLPIIWVAFQTVAGLVVGGTLIAGAAVGASAGTGVVAAGAGASGIAAGAEASGMAAGAGATVGAAGGSVGAGAGTAAGAAAKVGTSVATKIALSIAGATIVVGGGVATYFVIDNKKSDSEPSTTVDMVSDIDIYTDEPTAEPTDEPITEMLAEIPYEYSYVIPDEQNITWIGYGATGEKLEVSGLNITLLDDNYVAFKNAVDSYETTLHNGFLESTNDCIDFYNMDLENAYNGDASAFVDGNSYEISVVQNVTRADAKIFSIKESNYSYYGGPHPNSWLNGMNFDVETGNVLTIQDLTSDKEGLVNFIVADIKDQGLIDELFTTYFENINSYYDENYIKFICYEDHIEIFFNAYDIAPYYVGPITISADYKDIPGINEKFLK